MAFDHNRHVRNPCRQLYQSDPNLRSDERAQAIESRLAAETGAYAFANILLTIAGSVILLL